jgi:hypothetical protein
MRSIALVMILALVGACGSSKESGTDAGTGGSDAGTTGTTKSCDYTVSGAHGCFDWNWSGADQSAGFNAACTAAGGTPGGGCNRTGSIGGCKVNQGNYTTTLWFYPPSTTQGLQTYCTGQGTVVNP